MRHTVAMAPGIDIPAYCARIGDAGPLPATLATLKQLHRAHLLAIPFENLDIHWGRPIVLDETRLFDKIVTRRRGGFCYEQNGLFAAVLRALGFQVDLLEARVQAKTWETGRPWDHLVLLVTLEQRWLADVGFGESFREPLLLDEAGAQERPEGTWRVQHDGCEGVHSSRTAGGDWQAEYRFRLQPRQLRDFTPGCEYHQRSPDSNFTQQRVCSLATPTGRITLGDRRFIVTENGERQEQDLADEAGFQQLLQKYFGIATPPSAVRRNDDCGCC
ncbi:MAG: arylamine N-acetyltransferase [Anaerolineaceae bacterium]|nr:arylamine N-acetyltransferase [Anaerolineaceae bacterium]